MQRFDSSAVCRPDIYPSLFVCQGFWVRVTTSTHPVVAYNPSLRQHVALQLMRPPSPRLVEYSFATTVYRCHIMHVYVPTGVAAVLLTAQFSVDTRVAVEPLSPVSNHTQDTA